MTAPTRRAALRKLADAATPGPWQQSYFVDHPRYIPMGADWATARAAEESLLIRGPGRIGSPECNQIAAATRPDDRAYIAALDPTTVRQLLDIADRTIAYVEEMDRDWQEAKHPHESDDDLEPSWVTFRDDVRRLSAAFEEAHRE